MPSVLIPKTYIDQALARVDIVELIDHRVRLKKTGKNYSACCPFHDEKSPSFTVSPDKQMFYCFGCGAGGDAIRFLMDYDRLSFPDAALMVGRQAGLPDPENTETSQQVNMAIRWQEYKQLKSRILDARLFLAISGEQQYHEQEKTLIALKARKYGDCEAFDRRRQIETMMRDEKMEVIAHKLRISQQVNQQIALRLPPKVKTDEKRALLAQQRITRLQGMMNG